MDINSINSGLQTPSNSIVIQRLENQIDWYDAKASHCQKRYKFFKFIQIGLTIFLSAYPGTYSTILYDPTVIWGGGILLMIIEMIQQVNNYYPLWISYRSTCERLKNHKYLYFGHAEPYNHNEEKKNVATLATNIERIMSKENIDWINETKTNKSKELATDFLK